jgi:hypothetical protein
MEYHYYYALCSAVFYVLRQSFDCSRGQSLWRRVRVDFSGFSIAHPGMSAFSFFFSFVVVFAFSPSFFSSAPRLALRQILAMNLVFSPYFESVVVE